MEQFNSAPAADTVDQQLLPIVEEAPSPEPPDPKTCSPREYLEFYIFPVLLPGLTELLHEAEKEKCFEILFKSKFVHLTSKVTHRKLCSEGLFLFDGSQTVCLPRGRRTKFIASDFLTEWLYNMNPKRKDEPFTEFFSIPFVKDWLKDHPRPPIPLSLLLSEEEASIIIQSFWRGYRVRCDSEIQELRQWQKKWREEKHINKVVKQFWTKQEAKVGSTLEDLEEHTPDYSICQL